MTDSEIIKTYDMLGHSFIKESDLYFICTKCKIIVFYTNNIETYEKILTVSNRCEYRYNSKKLNVSCNEVIIKSIIE